MKRIGWLTLCLSIMLVGCQSDEGTSQASEWFSTIFSILACLFALYMGVLWLWSKIGPKIKVLQPFDTTLTSHNAANLVYHRSYKVKMINGKKVKWSPWFQKAGSILISPGECTIVFSLEEKQTDTHKVTAYNHSTKSNLEIGKTYFLRSYYDNKANVMVTYIEEGNENEKKKYVSGRWAVKTAYLDLERVGVNITPEKVQEFLGEFYLRMGKEGFFVVDAMGEEAWKLYEEIRKFPWSINKGEVYTYKTKKYSSELSKFINWMLLFSQNDLNILISFTNDEAYRKNESSNKDDLFDW